MKLLLKREPSGVASTIGELFVDGDFEAFTLEDPIREIEGEPVELWKIKGDTAIPAGTYKVDLTMSQRFQRILPIILDVPGFEGIRIHCGNTNADTEGCPLVGSSKGVEMIYGSRLAFSKLFPKMEKAKWQGEEITIEIVNP
jgi:Family of unknown function (DUF5675)